MKKRIIWSALIIIILLGAGYAFQEYNRKPADLSQKKAGLQIEATTLAADYVKNEEAANKKYLGKVVEVEGIIVQKNTENMVLGAETSDNNVSCTFDAAHLSGLNAVKEKQRVKVRGVCTGFLIDVELNRCVIVP